MVVAQFIFTQFANSFKVHVQNLEKLSVKQIQEIEDFVSKRKGVFDFNNYSFVIQKKIAFEEFVALIQSSELSARCQENAVVRETQARVGFGQYKGMHYNELPDSYMLWLKTNYRGSDREIIDKELKKRKL